MSNRLIDPQLFFETKFTELETQQSSAKLETMLSNLCNLMGSSQSTFLNSLPNLFITLLSPLNTIAELKSSNLIFTDDLRIILQDLIEKNNLIFSYITNENFLGKILDGLKLSLETDPLGLSFK
jgi:hypothetical protein